MCWRKRFIRHRLGILCGLSFLPWPRRKLPAIFARLPACAAERLRETMRKKLGHARSYELSKASLPSSHCNRPGIVGPRRSFVMNLVSSLKAMIQAESETRLLRTHALRGKKGSFPNFGSSLFFLALLFHCLSSATLFFFVVYARSSGDIDRGKKRESNYSQWISTR
jgi:hypothetical protein